MVNVHFTMRRRQSHVIITLCDIELLGKTLKHGDIEFNISESFYAGDVVPLDNALDALSQATIANLVGRESVEGAIRAGYIHEEAVLWIGDVPHAQWVRL